LAEQVVQRLPSQAQVQVRVLELLRLGLVLVADIYNTQQPFAS
jgi:hypothetical protein